MNVFTLLAMAAPPGGGSGGGSMVPTLIMFGAAFAIFYFLIIRPQKKRMNEHKALLAAITRGDKVVLTGGMHGTVHEIEDATVLVEIAKNVVVRMEKGSVQSVAKSE